ncbi:MAG: peptidoglycan DD-metalloendopeptidase family protein, partial [Rhodothermales bacterium]|nr:peptidoglycan DD-metalloendopeptidase family protein [Rhodothermales bacterium]
SVPNPGILIATESSAAVKAAFDGRVISVDIIPDFGTYVVIEHGEYHTVYSNFSLLYVGQNTVVSAGQVIGRAGTDAEPKGPGVFFAVFKKGEPMNPVPWLARL